MDASVDSGGVVRRLLESRDRCGTCMHLSDGLYGYRYDARRHWLVHGGMPAVERQARKKRYTSADDVPNV